MLHLRIIVPEELTSASMELLGAERGVTHLCLLPGAARQPAGDLIMCDVAREDASGILDQLKALDVDGRGAIMVEKVDLSLSASGDRAERLAPGDGPSAVVWQELLGKTGEEIKLSPIFLTYMVVAMVIASVGVLLDQPILIVGAMVVGPEFGPLAALCVGLVLGRWRQVGRSLLALGVGFAVGTVCTVGTTLALTAVGLVDKGMLTGARPLTGFIWQPDALSWVVGFFAGIAGMLSLTSEKSGALVGVLISVTTIPAAANAAAAIAYGVVGEAGGSLLQLVINLVSIAVGGVLVLGWQRVWPGLRSRLVPASRRS